MPMSCRALFLLIPHVQSPRPEPAYEDPLADLVHRVEAASAWRGPTAGGCLNFAAGCRSPQFLLHVPAGGDGGGGGGGGEPVRVSVVLEQDGGGSGGAFHPIGVLVARAGGGPIRELKASDQVRKCFFFCYCGSCCNKT